MDDLLPISFPDPKDLEGFQPLPFINRPLSCHQWDNLYLPLQSSRSVTSSLSPVRMGVCCFSVTFHISWKYDSEQSLALLNSRRTIFFIFLFITQSSGLLNQKDFSTSFSSTIGESAHVTLFLFPLTFSIAPSFASSQISSE